jgi:hypothetical protein
MNTLKFGSALAALASLLHLNAPFRDVQENAQARTVSDSVQVIHAAWRAASDGHAPRRAVVLWSASPSDTGQAVRLSSALRDSLARMGVRLESRQMVGDDTVHFRLTKWERDSLGDVLEFRSSWSTILGSGARACRTGSGNVERFRVLRVNRGWMATRSGPVIHGDRACVPIPPV